jgi:hypothetical protein
MFLTQLAETLRWEDTVTPFSTQAIGDSATRHGRDLLALGFAVSQVVHDYGDICPLSESPELFRLAPGSLGGREVFWSLTDSLTAIWLSRCRD